MNNEYLFQHTWVPGSTLWSQFSRILNEGFSEAESFLADSRRPSIANRKQALELLPYAEYDYV